MNISNEKDEVTKIVNTLPENGVICKEILNNINNSITKVVFDKSIKNSYYVFLNDTIYISDNEKTNKNCYRLCLISHECVHSMQNKIMQILNFFLSNIEMFSFIVFAILIIFNIHKLLFFKIYLIIMLISIVPRFFLETDASFKAPKYAKQYLIKKGYNNESNIVVNLYDTKIKLYFPFFVIYLFLGKFIRLGILAIILLY